MKIYDISQDLAEGIPVWPGDPEYRPRWVTRIGQGATSNVSAVEMCTHTGTHVDAPFHLDGSGECIGAMPLDPFAGAARIFSIDAEKCIHAADLQPLDWGDVHRVLFKTRNSGEPGNGIRADFIYLAEDAAEFLARKPLLLVGIDAPSVDAYDSEALAAHRILLGKNMAILEGALLRNVPPGDYELICLPLKLAGLDGSPVRAILRR